MTKQVRKIAGEYLRRQISGALSSEKIISVLESQGYTVVQYNSVSNSKDISELAALLGVGEYLRSSKGFTYADSNNRIVFLNEDLSEEERVYVLLHEQGHILCRHLWLSVHHSGFRRKSLLCSQSYKAGQCSKNVL